MATNCYLVICDETNQAAIIDPGGEAAKIFQAIEDIECEVSLIINTHGHADHVAGNKFLNEELGCSIAIHQLDSAMLTDTSEVVAQYLGLVGKQPKADTLLSDGDKLQVGNIEFAVIHTPGHTPGGVSLYNSGCLFSGDTLFKGSMGRHDLPGGNVNDLLNSLRKLCRLPGSTTVYPGHGPSTTVKDEREDNPYCQQALGEN